MCWFFEQEQAWRMWPRSTKVDETLDGGVRSKEGFCWTPYYTLIASQEASLARRHAGLTPIKTSAHAFSEDIYVIGRSSFISWGVMIIPRHADETLLKRHPIEVTSQQVQARVPENNFSAKAFNVGNMLGILAIDRQWRDVSSDMPLDRVQTNWLGRRGFRWFCCSRGGNFRSSEWL